MPGSRFRNAGRIVRPDELGRLGSAESSPAFAGECRFHTIYADPPWRFQNRSEKMAPEHKRLSWYATMTMDESFELPVATIAAEKSHLYLWCTNPCSQKGLETMQRWGSSYKSKIVWSKIRKDGGLDGCGVGFYCKNVTELVLFGIREKDNRMLKATPTQVNLVRY